MLFRNHHEEQEKESNASEDAVTSSLAVGVS